jgi:hypothetical protein
MFSVFTGTFDMFLFISFYFVLSSGKGEVFTGWEQSELRDAVKANALVEVAGCWDGQLIHRG